MCHLHHTIAIDAMLSSLQKLSKSRKVRRLALEQLAAEHEFQVDKIRWNSDSACIERWKQYAEYFLHNQDPDRDTVEAMEAATESDCQIIQSEAAKEIAQARADYRARRKQIRRHYS